LVMEFCGPSPWGLGIDKRTWGREDYH